MMKYWCDIKSKTYFLRYVVTFLNNPSSDYKHRTLSKQSIAVIEPRVILKQLGAF